MGNDLFEYRYDTGRGNGSISLEGTDFYFNAAAGRIDIDNFGVYARENSEFDIDAFLKEFGYPLKGAWYDAAGNMGRLDFLDDGILTLLSYGAIYHGTYECDNAEDTGTLYIDGKTLQIRFGKTSVDLGGLKFERGYVKQKAAGDEYGQIEGTWYDTNGKKGTAQFFKDGAVVLKSDGIATNAVCTFRPVSGEGSITVSGEGGTPELKFHLASGMLVIGDTVYAKKFTPQAESPIAGLWYSKDGRFGTLKISSDGSAQLDIMGGTYSGTYTFDAANGAGEISTVFNNQKWTFVLRLEDGALVVETGILIAGDVTYTRDNPEQGRVLRAAYAEVLHRVQKHAAAYFELVCVFRC